MGVRRDKAGGRCEEWREWETSPVVNKIAKSREWRWEFVVGLGNVRLQRRRWTDQVGSNGNGSIGS